MKKIGRGGKAGRGGKMGKGGRRKKMMGGGRGEWEVTNGSGLNQELHSLKKLTESMFIAQHICL